jgi:hypothetical protein
MSIILGIGIVTAITVLYLGRKGWQALHKVVGITPGVLIYQNPNAPLSLTDMTWQKLALDSQHLRNLPDKQLSQLQRIDVKVTHYHAYEQGLQAQHKISAISEAQFVLHKLIQVRLPEMLTSHYYLLNSATHSNGSMVDTGKRLEASQLLQEGLDNIEQRLDSLLHQIEAQHLQDLRVMKNYLDSHND